jgi:uroporphyrin-III C-methyltransferase
VSPRTDGVKRVNRGKVWLVGAGPGDPDLLTMRAHKLLGAAAVVAYDELVSAPILALAPPSAELIPVGRRAGGCRHHEARIHPLVIERALAGQDVVRLKGGDPFIFGRGGEEAEELAIARIPFAVVPGISAALGAAASTGIPLTHRECASGVTLVTAHASPGETALSTRTPREGTLVFYMGLARVRQTCDALVGAGRPPSTPAALVSKATTADERAVVGTLATIANLVEETRVEGPALLIVGDVVDRRVVSLVEAAASVRDSTAAAVRS